MSRPKTSQFLPPSGVYFSGAYTSMIAGLSLPEKQEILYQAAQGFEGGREALESWTRKDLLQLICLEMGKERKYTGVSKSKMVEHLLRLVSMKGLGKDVISPGFASPTSQFSLQSTYRRQRKGGRPARIPSANQTPVDGESKKAELSWVCRNAACKAQLLAGASFCQRCSCCICRNFDDNKDPSLWIVCTPEPLDMERDCRLSCHIECALNDGMAGVGVDGSNILLDGSYRCRSCGKISSLIGCWKKQLLIAREARRVDTLCQRLSLSHRLLNGTLKHKALHELVDRAIQKLEAEVGSITEGSSAKFARGLVIRLSSSVEVLKVIDLALEKAEALHEEMVSNSHSRVEASAIEEKNADMFCTIQFNEVSSSSILLTVKGGGEPVTGYRLWHRKASEASFPNNPTCIISTNSGRAQISSLQACTEYAFYVVPHSDRGIGEPAEARCITKSAELQLPRDSQVESGDQHHKHVLHPANAEKRICISDELESNFKVRDLGKVLHSAWGEDYQPARVIQGIFHGKGGVKNLNDDKNIEERKRECVSGVNVLSSPRADVSCVENGACKPSHDKALCNDLNVSANVDLGVEESRVTVEVAPPPPPIRTFSRRDSSGLLQQGEAKGPLLCAEVTELDDTSDPGNSHTSPRVETEAVSPIISDTLQANGANELHDVSEETLRIDDLESKGHGESWAVQVRSAGTAIGMEPQTAILRKRAMDGLERGDSYGLVNGCGGSGVGGALCAARNYEFCVKIVRWLECEGHLKEDFRMKFLTWFSLRASEHEKRVVSVFIDTLQDNPASLAGQLVDTFSDIISSKRHQMVSNGFCNNFWH